MTTPLVKKLGIKTASRIYVRNAPDAYRDLVQPLPSQVRIFKRLVRDLDLIHLFTRSRSELKSFLNHYPAYIRPNGCIWVSSPKRASGVTSDLNEHAIRELALPLGLVDIKVCAVDEVWSALKLVIRLSRRL